MLCEPQNKRFTSARTEACCNGAFSSETCESSEHYHITTLWSVSSRGSSNNETINNSGTKCSFYLHVAVNLSTLTLVTVITLFSLLNPLTLLDNYIFMTVGEKWRRLEFV